MLHSNNGVLLSAGHQQGTFILRTLTEAEFDDIEEFQAEPSLH
jgi:hypothetical protein